MGTVKTISLGCSNTTGIGGQSILSVDVRVAADPIQASQEFQATLSGTAGFPEAFLDAAQGIIMGGLREATLVDLQYIVQVRNGASLVGDTGDDPGVVLVADVSQLSPGEVRLCDFPADQECTQDGECQGGTCNAPIIIVEVPSSEDCAPGGECDGLGKGTTGEAGTQCGDNGFCVTGAIEVPLLPVTATYLAEASGNVLFGLADQGLSNNTFDPVTNLYTIPNPSLSNPLEQGLVVSAGLPVGLECVMGVDQGPDPEDGESTLVGLTPDEDLISFPIVE